MANYVVSDASLSAVADAIRSKGGTSEALTFQNGFVGAIRDISGGWVKTLAAVFNQTDRVFTTDELDDLRRFLTVTATYEDDTSEVVTGYELSGMLSAGTSTILVSYGDKMASFSVTVTEAVDVTPDFSSWSTSKSSVAVVKNTTDKTLLVQTNSNGSWRSAESGEIDVDEGFGYRLSAHVEYFAGTVCVSLAQSSGDMLLMISSPTTTSSGDYIADGIPSESNHYTAKGRLRFFVTMGTSMAGRAVFSNIKLIKYATTTQAEALHVLMGGESA